MPVSSLYQANFSFVLSETKHHKQLHSACSECSHCNSTTSATDGLGHNYAATSQELKLRGEIFAFFVTLLPESEVVDARGY